MSGSPYQEEELKPDAEASRVIADSDLINIDIKELNKMLKERGVPKVRKPVNKFGDDDSKYFVFTHIGFGCQAKAEKEDFEE